MLDGIGEQPPRLFQIIPGVQQPVDFCAVLSPLLKLVKITLVRVSSGRRFARRTRPTSMRDPRLRVRPTTLEPLPYPRRCRAGRGVLDPVGGTLH